MLLTAMIFASQGDSLSRIQRRCTSSGEISLFRAPDYRPSASDMLRLVNSYSPELAMFEVGDRDDAMKVADTLQMSCPNMAVLAFADNWQYESLIKTSSGYLKVIPTNLGLEDFQQAILDAVNASKAPGPDNVIVFMPAKAGSGASTIALNVTGCLANKCGKSSILIEADLHSGPAGMYLNLDPTYSVLDALQESHRLDVNWSDFITPVRNFAILSAWNIRGTVPQISPWSYRRLVAYTRQRYEYVIFDLPEVINPATEVIVTSAKAVYVVCTPEVPSLMLARKRAAGLVARGVSEDRLKIVLNRYSKAGPDPAAIAEILGYPISQVIPNDYKSLWEANLKRNLVDDKSTVGKALESFAWSLTGQPDHSNTIAGKAARKLFGLFPAA